jgi:hypothetical protein
MNRERHRQDQIFQRHQRPSSRVGSITFKVMIGSAAVTLVPTGADTFDGGTSLSPPAGSRFELIPFSDGVNSGYGL